MISPHKPEKRRHPRVDNSVPVKISSCSGDLVTETRNISCSGAYCRVSDYIEPMTRLSLMLLLPTRQGGRASSRKIVCNGIVVRAENIPFENAFNIAIFFDDIRPRDSKVLTEYIQTAMMVKK